MAKTCTVDGCESPTRTGGSPHCEKHYYRLRRTGTTDERPTLDRFVDDRGYVLLKRHGHPMADRRGYVYEHRLVAAESLGRSLERSEYVHHIDADPMNNAPDNLVVVDSGQHQRIHRLTDEGVDPHAAVTIVLSEG